MSASGYICNDLGVWVRPVTYVTTLGVWVRPVTYVATWGNVKEDVLQCRVVRVCTAHALRVYNTHPTL